MAGKNKSYNEDSIQVLEGLDPVRKRPSMYIGDVGTSGLHHMIEEVIDNSIDEAMAGECDTIDVLIDTEEYRVTVSDNGRGIPVRTHPKLKVPTVQVVLTKLHAGGKFNDQSYKVSGGLHGVGISCVNALSEHLTVRVGRDGSLWKQEYSKGKPTGKLQKVKDTKDTGTEIEFIPDEEIFETREFNIRRIKSRMEELSYLNPGITIKFTADGKTVSYYSERGVEGYLKSVIGSRKTLHSPFVISGKQDNVELDIAIQYTTAMNETIHSFVNNIRTASGGTHEEGLKRALTRVIKQRQEALGYKDNVDISGNDIRSGLTAVLSCRVPEPQFKGQTKSKLGNQEVRSIASNIIGDGLKNELLDNQKGTKAIITQAVSAAKARKAADHARDLTYSRCRSNPVASKPKKLSDARIREGAELFLCEGDSAGGTAKSARDAQTQAILPLRGKILKVEGKDVARVLKNKEIRSIIQSMGIGVPGGDDDQYRPEKLPYGKIIILTDADPDGHHITCLLLDFFYRIYPELVSEGRIYVAETPLYRALVKGKSQYYYSDKELPKNAKNIQRFKGLGEMNPDQLKETAMDPASRHLIQITTEDKRWSDETLTVMLGSSTKLRQQRVMEEFSDVVAEEERSE